MQRNKITWGVLLAISLLVGCKQKPANSPEQPASEQPQAAATEPAPAPRGDTPAAAASRRYAAPRPSGPIQFTDITEQAGIHFKHNTGAFGKKYLPETMGNGACFLDYDNDGWQDILIVNSMDWPEHKDREVVLRALSQQPR
jgi:hypothetical protein